MPTVAEEFLRISTAIPDDDRMIAPRILFEMVKTAHDEGKPIVNLADFHARARLNTAAAVERPDDHHAPPGRNGQAGAAAPWKSRLSTNETVLARRTAEILDGLRGHIEEWRINLSGQPTPPCATLAAAETWIIEHSAALTAPAPAGVPAVAIAYYPAAGGLSRRLANRLEHDIVWGLQKSAERFEEWTAIPAPAVIAHVLTGLMPGRLTRMSNGRLAALPGLSLVTMRVRQLPIRPFRYRITLELDIADLTDQNLRLVRQEAYRFAQMSPSPHRSATAKQQKIAAIVARLGGPPTTHYDVRFWRKVLKQFNRGAAKLVTDDPINIARQFWTARKRGVV